jgi:light-regulated signal transduction histidine kinase (bacteriophytochrome)
MELRAAQAELGKYREHLEDLVRQRTEELQAANRQLQDQIVVRRQAQEALRMARDELELRVQERTAELKAANEELARSNHDLEQFAYVSSHDLQEPLRMVASFVELLGAQYKGKLDDKADQYIGYAVEGAKRMQALIKDLLEYSRVNTRGRAFVPTDCEALLVKVQANLRLMIEESGAIIEHRPLPTVLADETQLMQVFQNLLENAIKFRRNDEPPRIHISAVREAGEWRFAIRDNGIGIAPEFHERIFVIFKRLHAQRHYPGTGIGLALVKRIAERHGGHVRVESAPGQGSTFSFTIPANQG